MKRRKTVQAGRLVWDVVYTVPNPRASQQERKRIREVTEAQIARTNCNTAQRKLELLIATNFEGSDLILTLTYRDVDLPSDYQTAQRRLYKVLTQVRQYRKMHDQPELKYIYVTEGLHGDHRLHHHVIINATENDLELVKSLWQWGDDIQLNYIRERGFDGWAGYLTKERRQASLNGKKQYVPSRNLKRPMTTYQWVDDGVTVDAPPGAVLLDEGGARNESASCRFVKYLLPKTYAHARVIADLKYPVTNHSGMEKKRKRSGQSKRMLYNKRQE